jgi:Amidohydrolase family
MSHSILSSRKTAAGRVFLVLLPLLALLFPISASAQRDAADIPTVTHSIALRGVRIVQAPGMVIEKGTVLVRDGLIIDVGADVAIPYDAEIIDADSMTVYPAFIDGLSTTGVPKPKAQTDLPSVDDPGNPPNDRAGIEPERDVRTMLSSSEKSIKALREAGFGAAQVVPEGKLLPGSASLILLGSGSSDELVFRGDTGLFAQFVGGRRVYPATPMGMTAKIRQLYREAERRKGMEKAYEADPRGRARPPYDAVHSAFFPVIEGRKPIIFFVDDALEIYRALKLKNTLGFSIVLTGLNEAFDALDELEQASVPLFLTLNLPKKPKWMAKVEQDSLDTLMASYNAETRTATFRDLEAEKRNLEAKQLISRARYASVAADLRERGLHFGFSTKGVKPGELRSNIREMISRGLSEDDALAALTTDAADLLGVGESLGSVEKGKIANLLVVDGPLFGEKTHYRYMFVEGNKFEYDVKKKKKKEAGEDKDSPADVLGSWTFTAYTPDGEQSGTVVFARSPDSYTGTIDYGDGSAPVTISSVDYEDGILSFSWQDPMNGAMTVEGSVKGNSFEGTADVGGQFMDVSGIRTSSPSL